MTLPSQGIDGPSTEHVVHFHVQAAGRRAERYSASLFDSEVMRQLSMLPPHTPNGVLAGPVPLCVHMRLKEEHCLRGQPAHDTFWGATARCSQAMFLAHL